MPPLSLSLQAYLSAAALFNEPGLNKKKWVRGRVNDTCSLLGFLILIRGKHSFSQPKKKKSNQPICEREGAANDIVTGNPYKIITSICHFTTMYKLRLHDSMSLLLSTNSKKIEEE